ncbi:MAG: HNH endonuclease [Williamsia herbipolensis]|nr:HNH endonuclease [Williamsia herbipolensis]
MPRIPLRLAALAACGAATIALLSAPPASAASPGMRSSAAGDTVSEPLDTLIADLPVDDTAHSGYERDLFKTWVDADGDGCDTREEVLKAEAVEAPTQGSSCTLSGGEWYSWYDEATWTDKSDVDIDHVVPLGEVWTSGGYDWSSSRREAYANDLGDDRTLEAVTDNVNESKGDRDPAVWMPPAASATCKYIDYWVAVKARWGLTADDDEIAALQDYAADCSNTTITVTLA